MLLLCASSQGAPIEALDFLQLREVRWLEQQIKEGTFKGERIKYWPIESLDPIRAVRCTPTCACHAPCQHVAQCVIAPCDGSAE